MKIRTQISLLFLLISAVILLIFAYTIYQSADKVREKSFYTRLKNEAITKANLFFDEQVSSQTMQRIYQNNRQTINEVEVAIYDSNFQLVYHDASQIDFVKETKQMMNEVFKKGEVKFYKGRWQIVGIPYHHYHHTYLLTAAAIDQEGYVNIDQLFTTMSIVWILSLLVLYFVAIVFAKRVLQPIHLITTKARQISATNLDLRLTIPPSKDEISEMSITFNQMLDRLQQSFEAQKSFVSNISHELRTPLAAIVAELELSTQKVRTNHEYKLVIVNALSDAKKIVRLSNSLLDFAKATYDTANIAFKSLRIDEVLLDARLLLLKTNPEFKIDIHFESQFDEESVVSVHANEYLLKVAFMNLMENGCKFSYDKKVLVLLSFDKKNIFISFSDNGIGISAQDLEHLFAPFYRGENKSFAEGNGIGLSLTQKIVFLHEGSIRAESEKDFGTTFHIQLPHF
ncbi:integral membrane sensor signal transduction histidine kinase (plasmid) [Emticicia oligotrophica DSM 17448]|uniref:histidine kinase n=1 Tax=Emticicia oligotrophica (strain DSM 17448 / CIP 109782 / MTCC 6937 / GPTSA100-15) TaxID=929562 RepID=A0ABM5N7T7_EMTOG|nr:HAMP domain-containing sensor histidine kinase [Emticicia oligotrophica]AFK05559.1 integral membrane sensor signal transduction histidine kinase [Emticicia oligotrophica DSM 17448]